MELITGCTILRLVIGSMSLKVVCMSSKLSFVTRIDSSGLQSKNSIFFLNSFKELPLFLDLLFSALASLKILSTPSIESASSHNFRERSVILAWC